MPKELGFAVVGLGMGMHHCKAIANARGARLAAVCDVDEDRLHAAVQQYGCKGYSDYGDVLKDRDVDVVNIVTESGKHARMGIQAAQAGKHLIVEKPVDITPDRIGKLQDAVERAGVKCGCIFQSRLDNVNVLIKKALDRGKLGRLIGIHASLPWFRAQSYFEGPHGPWRGTWGMDGGGSLMNQGIHTLDLCIHFAGRVQSAFGYHGVYDHDIEAEDHVAAVLRFQNGAIGTLFTTTCSRPEGAQRIYMFGTKGSFVLQGGKLESYDMDTPKERERMMRLFGGQSSADAASRDPMAVSADGHMLIIEDLVKAVRQDREPIIPLASARHSVEVACAIYEAGRKGKEVRIRGTVRQPA